MRLCWGVRRNGDGKKGVLHRSGKGTADQWRDHRGGSSCHRRQWGAGRILSIAAANKAAEEAELIL